MNIILSCALVFLISVILTEVIRKQAVKRAILDIPNHRSSHTVATPRGGGVAIAVVWYVGLVIMFLIGEVDKRLFLALFAGIILSVVSFVDDIRNLSPEVRFMAQLTSAILALIALGGSNLIQVGSFTYNNVWLLSFFAVPFIIWFINLFNFLDGIDGYLGMEAILVFAGLWSFTGNSLLLILTFAVFGFLFWNWPAPKAKIFCGDVGSTLIGFNVAIFAIYFQNSGQLSIVIPLVLTSLFWFDATLTLYRRWRNNEKLSEAHRKHAYQRIVQYGYSHAKTVYIAIALNVVLILISFAIYNWNSLAIWGLLGAVIVLRLFMKAVDDKKPFDKA